MAERVSFEDLANRKTRASFDDLAIRIASPLTRRCNMDECHTVTPPRASP